MKKFLVSFLVLGIFVLYSILLRHKLPVFSKPSSLTSASVSSKNQTTATSSSIPSNSSTTSSSPVASSPPKSLGQYKDGTFNGSVANAYWGNVQVAAVVSGGKITHVKVLQYPNSHPASVYINQQVMPYLQQETIKSQNANIQVISGATFSSEAFIQSLSSALKHAKA